jgi:hypothetical protein
LSSVASANRSKALELIRGHVPEKPIAPRKAFLSYVVTNDNRYLIENLVDRFLTLLGFEVVYYNKNFVPGRPASEVIQELIDQCNILLAFFTNETREGDHWITGGNVPHEIGCASHHCIIALMEKNNRVPSNVWSARCVAPEPFERERPAGALLILLDVLKRKGLV